MTDPKTEWRDEEGRELTVMSGGWFAMKLEQHPKGEGLSGLFTYDDARFLLRYLPEALGFGLGEHILERLEKLAERVLARDNDLSDAQTGSLAKTVDNAELLRRVQLDAAIVTAAENWFDARADDYGTSGDLVEAVRAKREALKGKS